MAKGRAPIDLVSGEKIELEHIIPQRTGESGMHSLLLEVTPLEHAFFDRFRYAADISGNKWKWTVYSDTR